MSRERVASPHISLTALRRNLNRWYRRSHRDLPWRRTRDPYIIWLSEVMLQQTRVETVLGRYELFLERFPSITALAAAPLDDVLAEWSGLGYYRRPRALHALARTVVEKQGQAAKVQRGGERVTGAVVQRDRKKINVRL